MQGAEGYAIEYVTVHVIQRVGCDSLRCMFAGDRRAKAGGGAESLETLEKSVSSLHDKMVLTCQKDQASEIKVRHVVQHVVHRERACLPSPTSIAY